MPTRTLAALLLLAASPLDAQGPPLTVGTRVRATTTPASTTLTGVYRGLDQGAFTLQVDASTHRIPRETIAKLEQSTGRKANVTTGILGAILGAGIGGALACFANTDDYGVYCGGQDDTKVIIGAVIGGLAGGAAGALLFKREGWREIRVP